jgi:AGCS family alanine or glycine:cation symporter
MHRRSYLPTPLVVAAVSIPLALDFLAPQARAGQADLQPRWMQEVDRLFAKYLVAPVEAVLFYDLGQPYAQLTGRPLPTRIPFVLVWLIAGATYFTLLMRFINVRAFWHAIRLTKGDYDDPDHDGEVSHFQALSSALSGTLGLGNIGGVAIAIAAGGPGATVWMILAGLLGMSSKFTECTLGQMYRRIDPSGVVAGGPMYYLRDGLAQRGLRRTGAALAALFALMCMGGSVGGGCAFQVNQSLGAVRGQVGFFDHYPWAYGLACAFFVGLVIVGGIRRIAAAAEKIVPFMCGLYLLCALVIIIVNAGQVVGAVSEIFRGAFQGQAVYGGVLGVMVQGFRRAAFSNEAGIGSASIAHSAARTDIPVREGLVALLEPFIDTVVVCTITALVIVISGVYKNPAFGAADGSQLTVAAFATVADWFPWLLSAIIVLFAYSTMITWAYYGERCWTYLFGPRGSVIFSAIFLIFVLLGSVVTATHVLDFSDLMIFSMAIPNLIGAYLLGGQVRCALDDYWRRYQAGEFQPRRGDY